MPSGKEDIRRTTFTNWLKVAPDVARKEYWYIVYASFRLDLNVFISALLGHLGWCLELYILNFPLLNVFARRQLVWIVLCLWPYKALLSQDVLDSESHGKEEAARRRKKAIQKVTKDARTISLFLFITLALHHNQSPIRSERLCNVVEWMSERRLLLACYVLMMQSLPRSSIVASFSLSGFFYAVRIWKLLIRFSRLVLRLLESEVWVRVEPMIPYLLTVPFRLLWSVLQWQLITMVSFTAKDIWDGERCLTCLFASIWVFVRSYYSFSFWTCWMPVGLATLRELITINRMFQESDLLNTKAQQVRRLPQFSYSSIKTLHGIRLLLIHPRRSIDPVTCTLFETQLSNLPSYEAISYCWGSSKFTDSIIVNKRSVKITANAHEALRKRSSAFEPKLVWIDSICVCQQDDFEKARQVSLMGEIYRNAKLVSVVLMVQANIEQFRQEAASMVGNDLIQTYFDKPMASGSTHMREYLVELVKYIMAASAADVVEELRAVYFSGNSKSFSTFQKYSGQRRSYRMRCFRVFLSNPWFERTWVVQEIALAQNVRLVYGDEEIRWSALDNALSLTEMHSLLAGPILESGDEVGLRRAPPVGSVNFSTFDVVRGLITNDERRNLVDLLRLCRLFKATKPRDKLFAIHGLLMNWPKDLLRPTYNESQSLQEVFINAAECIIAEGDPAKLLSSAGDEIPFVLTEQEQITIQQKREKGLQEEDLEVELPSWVPNWAKMQRGRRLSYSYPGTDYSAGGKSSMDAHIDGRTLIVEGYVFDTVEEEGSLYYPVPIDYGANGRHMMLEVAAAYKVAKTLVSKSERVKNPYQWSPTKPEQSLWEAFWRTLIGNRTSDECPAPPSLAASVEVAEELFEKLEADPGFMNHEEAPTEWQERLHPIAEFMHPIHRTWSGRKFCITTKGLIGLIPGESRAGDSILVLPGMQVPCMARKVHQDRLSQRKNKWKYVGECYLHGIMSGEALRMDLELRKIEFF